MKKLIKIIFGNATTDPSTGDALSQEARIRAASKQLRRKLAKKRKQKLSDDARLEKALAKLRHQPKTL